MKIIEIIKNCIQQNQAIGLYLNSIDLNKQSPDEIMKEFKLRLIEFNYSTALQSKFMQLLQLLDDKALIDEFKLQDLHDLLESAVKIEEANLDQYIELAHLNRAVLDDEIKAREIAGKGIEVAGRMIEELQSLIIIMDQELKDKENRVNE